MRKVLTFFLLAICLHACSQGADQGQSNAPRTNKPQEHMHASFFQDRRLYDQMYDEADEEDRLREEIAGAILPHHLVVGREMARTYQKMESQEPQVVVVLGPNHFEKGKGKILTTDLAYATPYGALEPAQGIITALAKTGAMGIDPEPFAREHSISAHVAFIRRSFPKAFLVPIILKQSVTAEEAKNFGFLLSRILPEKSLIIASVDFSHYQPEVVADFHDRMSLATLENADMSRIGDVESDSPASLITLLRYLGERKSLRTVYAAETNSASFLKQPYLPETTSHLFLAFAKGEAKHHLGIGMLAFGDAIFDRGMRPLLAIRHGESLLEEIQGKENRFFRGTDVTLLNLEGPITDIIPRKGKPVNFRFDAEPTLRILRSAKVNLVNLANNHSADAGEEGLRDTIAHLTAAGIDHIGGDAPCMRKEIASSAIAFCGFDDSERQLSEEETLKTIRTWKTQSDRLVVAIHWGAEYVTEPRERQITLAHAFIEAGADAVIGHHPHVIQPLEIYRGAPIFYSLGNFLFDQTEPATSLGLGAGIFFEEKKTTLYLYPFRITGGRPKLLPWSERKNVLEKYLRGMENFGTELTGKIVVPRSS